MDKYSALLYIMSVGVAYFICHAVLPSPSRVGSRLGGSHIGCPCEGISMKSLEAGLVHRSQGNIYSVIPWWQVHTLPSGDLIGGRYGIYAGYNLLLIASAVG